jgi:transposase-like protein
VGVSEVRWCLAYPLSSRQVLELLADRCIDVSHRTILTWSQVFGPLLAAEVRRRRRVGGRWFVNDVFLFRKTEKRYLYRAIDEHGQVVDMLLRDHRQGECPRCARPSSAWNGCLRRSSSITISRT